MNTSEIETLLQREYGQPSLFFRDATLPPEILKKYQPGTFLREPTFCDATYKFGGLIAPHRFQIISSNARCIDEFSIHPEWGLCIWQTGTRFKIIDRMDVGKFCQISLLEVIEELMPFFTSGASKELEELLSRQSRDNFRQALRMEPLPELDNDEWRDRLLLPIGINDHGSLFK